MAREGPVVDPNPKPDVHSLFFSYNFTYFDDSLGACAVSWTSDRLVSGASTCVCYPNQGWCEILLSKPLLERRRDSDLKNKLLHEMIHAYLFLKFGHSDHSYHGDEFLQMMKQINSSSVPDRYRPTGGYNIITKHGFINEPQSSSKKARKRVISDSDSEEKYCNKRPCTTPMAAKRLLKADYKLKGKSKENEETEKRRKRKLIIDYESDDFSELDTCYQYKSKQKLSNGVTIQEPNESIKGQAGTTTKRQGKLDYKVKDKAKLNKEIEKKPKKKVVLDYDYDFFSDPTVFSENKSKKKPSSSISINEPNENNFEGRDSLATQAAAKRPGTVDYKLKGKAKVIEEMVKKKKRKARFDTGYDEFSDLKSKKKPCNGISIEEPTGTNRNGASSKCKQIVSTHALKLNRCNDQNKNERHTSEKEEKKNIPL